MKQQPSEATGYSKVSGGNINASWYKKGKYYDGEGNQVDISEHLAENSSLNDEDTIEPSNTIESVKPLPPEDELKAMERDALLYMYYQRTSEQPPAGKSAKKDLIAGLVEHDKEHNPDNYTDLDSE